MLVTILYLMVYNDTKGYIYTARDHIYTRMYFNCYWYGYCL